MKLIFAALLLFLSFSSSAQVDSTTAPYKQFPFIPPFSIMKAPDSTAFTRDDLPRRKPVIIMVFSPDCDHCKHQVEAMLKDIDKLSKYQIVMTTWLPFEQMMKFYDELKIKDYPNIIMARDTKFFFPVHYQIKALPGIFIYNKKHILQKNFESTVKVEKLVE